MPFNVLTKGIGEEFANMGIKIFGHWLRLVSAQYVNKVIVCKRRENIVQDESLMNAFREEAKVRSSSETREALLKNVPTLSDLGVIRRKNYREVRKFLKKNKHIDSIVMYYEDTIEYPEEELTKLAKFLGLEPTTMQEAIDNIDKK